MQTERYSYECAACGSGDLRHHIEVDEVEIPVLDKLGRAVYTTKKDRETGAKKNVQVTRTVPVRGLGTFTCRNCGGKKVKRDLINETTKGARTLSEYVQQAVGA